MAVEGAPRNYDQKFNFGIEIDDIDIAWFSAMSSLEAEVGVVEQHEGGSLNVADQAPGKVKFAEVTLSVGATDNRQLYDWWLQVIDAGSGVNGTGLTAGKYKRNVSLVQRDRDGTTKRRWDLYEAWPRKFVAGEWDGNAEENAIQQVVLVFKRFELTQ